MGRTLIEIKDLAFRHAADMPWLWQELDFQLEEGETISVMGPSGCGKSSLLRLILGSLLPNRGSVVTQPGARISMVFQDQRLLPWKTSWENVAFGITQDEHNRVRRQALAEQALESVHAQHLGRRYPHQLSGGEKQRVALARALVGQADIILMDEPLSAIDAISQRSLLSCLLEIKQQQKTSILYVTHSQEEARLIGDRVLLYANGKLHEQGLQTKRREQQLEWSRWIA